MTNYIVTQTLYRLDINSQLYGCSHSSRPMNTRLNIIHKVKYISWMEWHGKKTIHNMYYSFSWTEIKLSQETIKKTSVIHGPAFAVWSDLTLLFPKILEATSCGTYRAHYVGCRFRHRTMYLNSWKVHNWILKNLAEQKALQGEAISSRWGHKVKVWPSFVWWSQHLSAPTKQNA